MDPRAKDAPAAAEEDAEDLELDDVRGTDVGANGLDNKGRGIGADDTTGAGWAGGAAIASAAGDTYTEEAVAEANAAANDVGREGATTGRTKSVAAEKAGADCTGGADHTGAFNTTDDDVEVGAGAGAGATAVMAPVIASVTIAILGTDRRSGVSAGASSTGKPLESLGMTNFLAIVLCEPAEMDGPYSMLRATNEIWGIQRDAKNLKRNSKRTITQYHHKQKKRSRLHYKARGAMP